jgi:hypothetical protein
MYVLLTADTKQIIEHSAICSAEDLKTKNKKVVFDPDFEPDFMVEDNAERQKDNKSTTGLPRQSSPRKNTTKNQNRRLLRRPNTDPECTIPPDNNGGVFDDFFDANTQDLDIDHRREPGAPKPANQDVIPTVRRSLRNWCKVKRYARVAQACVVALCTWATFLSTHPFIPEFPPENTTDLTAYHTIVSTSRERVGSNPDSGKPTDMPSYAHTGLSHFEQEQLDYDKLRCWISIMRYMIYTGV